MVTTVGDRSHFISDDAVAAQDLVSSVGARVETLVIKFDQAPYKQFLQDAASSARSTRYSKIMASPSTSIFDARWVINRCIEAKKTVADPPDFAKCRRQHEYRRREGVLEVHESTVDRELDITNSILGLLFNSTTTFASAPRQGHPWGPNRLTRSKRAVLVQEWR